MHRSRVLAAVLLAGAATAGLGQNWDVERRLTNNTWFDATAGGTAHAISISGSSIHVVYYHNKGALYGYVVYYTRSTDRGVTWSTPESISHSPFANWARTPAVAVSGSGVHVCYTDYDASGSYIYTWYTRSTDGGVTKFGEDEL